MNIAHLLVAQATARPDSPAMIEGHEQGRRVSFAELDERSSRFASYLSSAGVTVGDRVLVFVPMGIDLYLALVAIFRVGAVAVFVDPSAGADHIDRCCQIASPAAMIAVTKAHLLRFWLPSVQKIRAKFSLGWPVPGARRWESGRNSPPAPAIAERRDDDPALLTFTSGSTGIPKAAVRSHGFLAAQHAALKNAINLMLGQVDLVTLPIFSLANLASGVTSVIPDADLSRPGAIDADPVLRQIVQHRVTRCVASPAFFERLLAARDSDETMSQMEDLYTGGAPVFPKLMERLQVASPRAGVHAAYGSTEAEPIAEISWREMSEDDRRAMADGSGLLVGKPVAEIELRVITNQWGSGLSPAVDGELDRCTLPPGEPGEIIVTGRHVLTGYLNGQGDEQTKWHVGEQIWHRTGDAGCLDDRGRLWLLGRAEARVTDSQGTLYPFAVECAASHIEGIARSAFVGHEGRRILIIQPTRGSAPGDLELSIKQRLAWTGITEIRFMKQIPVDKRHNAKIDYPALRQTLQA
jgi:acyl-CoA synthetase (AMP-forming)/AMP-acid ligase II